MITIKKIYYLKNKIKERKKLQYAFKCHSKGFGGCILFCGYITFSQIHLNSMYKLMTCISYSEISDLKLKLFHHPALSTLSEIINMENSFMPYYILQL